MQFAQRGVWRAETRINTECFLPVWEGVSPLKMSLTDAALFPPCMGGCIAPVPITATAAAVSSLYGRVYRVPMRHMKMLKSFLPVWEGVSWFSSVPPATPEFPPFMRGCIEVMQRWTRGEIVSSLYGRVYRRFSKFFSCGLRFLPVWEGVSLKDIMQTGKSEFPPCMGGCIA